MNQSNPRLIYVRPDNDNNKNWANTKPRGRPTSYIDSILGVDQLLDPVAREQLWDDIAIDLEVIGVARRCVAVGIVLWLPSFYVFVGARYVANQGFAYSPLPQSI